MGLFDLFKDLFKKWPDPAQELTDEVLGPMTWSSDSDAWGGKLGGLKFLIGYNREATPTRELLDYARGFLTDPARLSGSLETARGPAVQDYPELAEEIAALRFEEIYFYRSRDGIRRILTSLEGGQRDRSWRLEFTESHCEGLGYDT